MSGSISPTACYVDDAGIHAPAYPDILAYLQGRIQGIYGSDFYLGNDSQDEQMLGIFALALYDTNSMALAVYNSYAPSTAKGVGLSSVVKTNGIQRLLPTNSSVDVVLAGRAGTTINAGWVTDDNQQRWFLPATVTIPFSGAVTVTASAANAGDVTAAAGTVTGIGTPTLGWQTVTNPLAASRGAALESDAVLRQRQARSTMIPSVSAADGIIGAVSDVTGVTRSRLYENDTNVTDANGIPSHSLAFVVEGGDSLSIAQAIAVKKTPGAGTYGTTSEVVPDDRGVPHSYNFFRPTVVPLTVVVHITPLAGYTNAVGEEIVQAVIAYVNASLIGEDIYRSKVEAAANLTMPDTLTFNITSVLLARNIGTPSAADVVIAFNEAAFASSSTVTLSIP